MTLEEKNALLDALSVCYNRANAVVALAEANGLDREAERGRRAKRMLKLRIDALLGELFTNWSGEASKLGPKLEKRKRGLETCLKDLENGVRMAENVAKAAKYLDDAIKIAASVMK